jgi:hypothetical protein
MNLSADLNILIKDTKNYLHDLEATHLFFTDEECSLFAKEIQNLQSPKKLSKKEKTKTPDEVSPPKIKQNYISTPFPAKQKEPLQNIEKKNKEEKTIRKSFLKPLAPNQKVETFHSDFITLEKPTKTEISFEKIKNILEETAPTYPLIWQIPSDEKAKQISIGYQLKKKAAEVTILSYKESPQGLLFLKNLALAIETCFLPAKVVSALEIEEENGWEILLSEEDLKLVIAGDYSIWELPRLMPFYKEIPNKNEHFLQQTPLFMLPDISLYLKEPLLKKSLFAALRKKISL